MKECYPLFGKRIDLEEISFFVHGIVHDNPLISISPKFKEVVNEKLKGYPIICEDGFSEWITDSESFNEIKYFELNKIKPRQYLDCLKNYIYNRFVRKTHKTNLMKKVKSLRKVEDLEPLRKELFASYYPEPQGMNRIIEGTCGGTIDNPKGELPLRIRRYIYEAKESINYARKNNLDELHIIVGCAHELPLEYLLSTKRNI